MKQLFRRDTFTPADISHVQSALWLQVKQSCGVVATRGYLNDCYA